MPRSEGVLQGDHPDVVQFARDLRQLRAAAGGAPYRQMATRAHYSAAALSQAANGRTLPSLSVTRAYVLACDGDVAEWESRWRRLAAQLADCTTPDGDTERSQDAPYVGLRSFQAADADRFFGRDRVLTDLVARVRRSRLVVVFGASGAGKSSLLRAGLIALADTTGLDAAGSTPTLVLTPGPHPIEECAVQVAAWSGRSVAALRTEFREYPENLHLRIRQALVERRSQGDLLLVVDQFEEVFTLCQDPAERDAFLASLSAAVDADTARTRVVLGVRADFLAQCTDYPLLVRAVNDAAVVVGPMSADELRLAITEPARGNGLTVETALVARLVADAVAQPAALPLVSHALLATWERRRGNTLSLDGYESVGGIRDAVARTAEEQYQALSADEQCLAKQLFLRLVAIGDATAGQATPDTRRRIRPGEMTGLGPDMTHVLAVLVHARLITSDDTGIEIAHEALIHAWPRLRDWLEDDRDGLRTHRLLTETVQQWESAGCDPDVLYRGSRLDAAARWAEHNDTALVGAEREFLAAATAARAEQWTRSRHRTRRLRQLAGLLVVLLFVATVTSVIAVRSQQTAVQQRNEAIVQNGFSQATALANTNPALAMQLALAAYRLDPTQPIRSSVLNSLAAPYVEPLTTLGDSIVTAPISRDGTLLATWNGLGNPIQIWDLADAQHPRAVAALPWQDPTTPELAIAPIALNAHRHLVLTAPVQNYRAGLAPLTGGQLWDFTVPAHPALLASLPGRWSFGAIDDGHLLTTGNVLWDITNPRAPVKDATLPTDASGQVMFSRDGRTLVAVARKAHGLDVDLFDISSPHHPDRTGMIPLATGDVSAIAINPTGTVLAVGTASGETQLWAISTIHRPVLAATLTPQTGPVSGLVFNPDGDALASSTSDGSINVWSVATDVPRELTSLIGRTTSDQVQAALVGMTFGSDGSSLLVAGVDNSAELVRLPDLALTSRGDYSDSMTFSPDGRTAAISDASGVHLWDLRDPARPRPTGVLSAPDPSTDPDASDVGNYVLLGRRDQILITGGHYMTGLWNIANPSRPRLLASMTNTGGPFALSPDGRLLISRSSIKMTTPTGGTATRIAGLGLWSIADPRNPRLLGTIAEDGATALDYDGHQLAIAGEHGVDLWDISDPSNPQMLDRFTQSDETTVTPFLHLSFLPHTHTLAVATWNGAVQLWNTANPLQPTITGTLPRGPTTDNVNALIAVSPNGRLLATAGANQTVLVWQVSDPAHPVLLDVLTDATNPVAFSPDGHTLAVIDTNGAVRLRETDLRHAAARLCAVTGRTLDPATWNRYFPGLAYQSPC